jgi:hypothetical protein
VQVHYDEGVAIRIGPEPCVGVREDDNEASVGEGIGQPLSRESLVPGADAVSSAEGNTIGRAIRERPLDPAWSKNLACAEAPWTGTGRSHVRPMAQLPARSASGR